VERLGRTRLGGHTWGYRNFETQECSTNNWWVAILAFGEHQGSA